jgi:hypothetical protein
MKPKDAVEFKGQRDDAGLDRCYGKIGISAVAAAIAYQGEVKNSVEPPSDPRAERWLAEQAAA